MSATQAKPPARLSDAQLADMMRLIGGADSVELKLTIPEDAQRATISNLNLDPVEAQPRQVFFFDTPTLTLDKAGVVVRARRTQGGAGDTVVKLRPVQPDDAAEELAQSTPPSRSRSTRSRVATSARGRSRARRRARRFAT